MAFLVHVKYIITSLNLDIVILSKRKAYYDKFEMRLNCQKTLHQLNRQCSRFQSISYDR